MTKLQKSLVFIFILLLRASFGYAFKNWICQVEKVNILGKSIGKKKG